MDGRDARSCNRTLTAHICRSNVVVNFKGIVLLGITTPASVECALYFVLVILLSLAFCVLFLRSEPLLTWVVKPRGDGAARQSSHTGDPSRLGGAAVLASLTVGVGISGMGDAENFGPLLLLSALPVLIAGIAEDLGHRVSPRGRFIAALVSAITAVAMLGAWVPRSDLPGLDLLMSSSPFAILLTVVFSAVYCHAVNLIDGMNGLAVSVIATAALGCAAVAMQAGEPEILSFALLLAAATLGFLLLNWPVARLFLGDAGAYGLGHLLVWLMVLLCWHSNEVAVPAMMLVIFWPIADVIHTALRRIASGAPIMQPDRMHLHQKVRRMLDIIWLGYNRRGLSNPLTMLVLLPFICAPVVAGVLLWNRPVAAWITLVGFLLAFAITNAILPRLAQRFRK